MAVERLEKEKTAKTNDLLSVLGCGAIGSPVNDKADNLFLMKCSQQLKESTGKTNSTVFCESTVDEFTDECLFQTVLASRTPPSSRSSTTRRVWRFFNVAVTKQNEWFPVKESAKSWALISFLKSFSDGFFRERFSIIGFNMGNAESTRTCVKDWVIRLIELKPALTGKENTRNTPLRFSRLVALQLNT